MEIPAQDTIVMRYSGVELRCAAEGSRQFARLEGYGVFGLADFTLHFFGRLTTASGQHGAELAGGEAIVASQCILHGLDVLERQVQVAIDVIAEGVLPLHEDDSQFIPQIVEIDGGSAIART